MKIVNVKTNIIYTVVDTTPDQSKNEVHSNQANLMLDRNHQDDGGDWAEVEEVKEKKKRAPRKPATPKPSQDK